MSEYKFDKVSLIRDSKRWFPVMGEIHYSRVPEKLWAETLSKMKAGGVDIVSAYVIWIHHEEIEGEYDWSGNRNLKGFIEAVKESGLKLLLRIGPWCHGEARNGGFPDWLLHKDFEVRTNDEKYFAEVKKWYREIFEQVRDYLKDENCDPFVGVQIENEFGHCGGLWDETGEDHMKRLQQMAQNIGFNVPLYTATGWGGARTGGMLPVMGGYCDAPWDASTEEIEPSGNFIFTKERNDHNIGSDHGFGYGITFDIDKFPYLTAELGGGLQVTQHRRTIATARDIAAVSTTKLGSGVNLLGYYMYAGGTNPEGKLTTLQESKETGYPNDLPVKSYDFRAPVREFGQVSDTLRELKLLTYFVHSYGEDLCTLPAQIPQSNPLDPKDTEHLRYSYRSDGSRGYLFINNHVRHQKLASHKNVKLYSPDNKTALPELNIDNGDYFFLPFNMTYGNTKVVSSTVTPLCSAGNLYVFYGRKNQSAIMKSFETEDGIKDSFLVLSREDALNTWKTSDGRLFITNSDGFVLENPDGTVTVSGKGSPEFCVYPDLDKIPQDFKKTGTVNKNIDTSLPPVEFTVYKRELSSAEGSIKVSSQDFARCRLDFSQILQSLDDKEKSDCFVKLDYIGESAQLYGYKGNERKLILDHFWLGEEYPWEIGLKRFIDSDVDFSKLELEINPLKKNAKIYLEKWPEICGEQRADLINVSYEYEWKFKL